MGNFASGKRKNTFMNEIEALKQELKQTKLAYLMAMQMSQFKSGFLARTAHELRSPLSSLIGLHQIILSNLCENPEEEKEFLAQSYQTAQQFLKLLDELISISKLDCGAVELEIQPVQLSKFFADLQQLTHMQAKNRRITIEIADFPTDACVMADYQRLLQLFVYSIDTSISHLKEGKIRISAFSDRHSNPLKGCIDIDLPVNIWDESIDLLHSAPESPPITKPTLAETNLLVQNLNMSPGMKLWVAQTLLEIMGGQLTVLEASSDNDTNKITRLRCWLPLATAKSVALEPKED
jgi:K+-sensing histidine kinase KdpD